jgi:hypothetical protein
MSMSCGIFVQFFKCEILLGKFVSFIAAVHCVLLGTRKTGQMCDVIQLSKFLNHTLATHNQVESFFENINHNDGKGAFTLTLFEMTIKDCPGFHVPHCTAVEGLGINDGFE